MSAKKRAQSLSLLSCDPAIRSRVLEIRSEVVSRTVCDRVYLLDSLRKAIDMSLDGEKPNPSAAIRGIELASRQPELKLFPAHDREQHGIEKLLESMFGGDEAKMIATAKELGLIREHDITPEPVTPELKAEFRAHEAETVQ